MAQLDPGTYGGFDEEEARRRAFRARAGQSDPSDPFGGPQESEGNPGDFLSPSSQPTVAQQQAPRDAHDRRDMSVLERNEQSEMGPFANAPMSANQRENRAGTQWAISAEDRAMMDRVIADSQRQEAQRRAELAAQASAPQQGNPLQGAIDFVGGVAEGTRKTLFPTAQEIRAESPIEKITRPLSAATTVLPVGGIVKAAAPFVKPLAGGIDDFGAAITRRLGIGAQAAKPAAAPLTTAGREGARGVLVGAPRQAAQYGVRIDDMLYASDDAAALANRVRSARAGAGAADDTARAAQEGAAIHAGTAQRIGAQQTPLAQAIAGRLRSTPVIAGTSALAGAGAGLLGAGVLQPQAGPGDGGAQIGQKKGQQTETGGPETPPQAIRQGAQITPEQQAAMQAEIDRVARENAARNAPQGGQAPYAPQGGQPPQTGQVPGAPGTATPTPSIGGAPVPPGGRTLPRLGTPPPGTNEAPPVIGQPGVGQPPIGAAPGRGRAGGPPMGVTPGQTPAGPTTGPVPQGPLNSEAMRTQVIADLNGIAQQINAGPQAPDVMALFLSQGSKLLDLIAEQEKALRAQSAQDGSTIDPATQNTLDTLREQLNLQLKSTKERLNARGLLDSGILVEAEQMLVKGNLSDQAKILAERLSRIQNNLNSGLASFRSQRIDTAGRFGMAGAQAQTQAEEAERRRMDDLKRVLVSGRLDVAGQYGREEQSYLDRESRAYENDLQRDFTARQNDLDRQAAMAKYQADLAARAGDREAEQAFRAQESALQRENARLIAEMQPSSTSVDLATNNVVATLQAAGATYEDAVATMNAYRGQPGYETVDWNAVIAKFPQQSGGFKFPWQP